MRYFALAAVMLCAFASCEEVEQPKDKEENKEENQGKVEAPEIQIATKEISIESDGTVIDIVYAIKNPTDGEKLVVENEAEWLDVNTDKARIISLSAEVNETGQVRETELLLKYKDAENVVLKVSQGFFVNPLAVAISDVSATGVTFSITTSDPELTWIPMVTYKESFEYWESPDELFQNDLEYFAYLADIRDMTRAEFIESMVAVGSMENVHLDGLQPSNDYVLYAYGITPEGRRTTDIISAPFTTEPPYEGDITFTFDVVEEDYILNYTITPSHTGVPFYYGAVEKEELDRWKSMHNNDLRAAIQAEEIDSLLDELLDLGMISGPEDYFTLYSESNVVDWGYQELKASTKYVLFAVKWDEECRLMGPVSTYEHESQPVDMSDNQITLEVTNITQSSADAIATVTNDDPYVVMPVRKSELDGLTDEEIFEYVATKYDYIMSEYTFTGNKTKMFTRMRPSTEYTIIAFGYKAGTMTTSEMDKVDFVTLPAGDPLDCTFEFNIQPDVDHAFIEVNPSDKGHFYHWFVYPSSYTADDAKNFIRMYIKEMYDGDFATFASWELSLGYNSADAWDLIPGDEYKVGAVIMDYDTGEFLSEMVFSEPFRTLEKVYADIQFNFNFGPYYDLGELIMAGQTQFNELLTDGDAILPIKLSVKGECSAYYYTIYQNDLMDTVKYIDEIFYDGLIAAGCPRPSSNFVVRYDTPSTLVAIGYDNEGNVSQVYRQLLNFTKDGSSPVKDFIETLPRKASAYFHADDTPARYSALPSVTRQLPENHISAEELQAKHDAAMAKVRNLRRERLMKEITEIKLRKEKRIAK